MVASVSETDQDTMKRCLTSLVDCSGHEVPTGLHFGLSCSEDLADEAVANVAGGEVAAVGAVLVLAAFSFEVVLSVDGSDRLAMCSGLGCAVESVGAVELVVETLFSLEVGMLEA